MPCPFTSHTHSLDLRGSTLGSIRAQLERFNSCFTLVAGRVLNQRAEGVKYSVAMQNGTTL